MTSAQLRVLAILATAMGVHIAFSPTRKADFLQFLGSAVDGNWADTWHTLQHDIAWIGGVFVIELITAGAPTIGTWMAVLILALAVFANGQAVAGAITGAVAQVTPAGSMPSYAPPEKKVG